MKSFLKLISRSKQTFTFLLRNVSISHLNRTVTLMHRKDTSDLSLVSIASLKINRRIFPNFSLIILVAISRLILKSNVILLEFSHFNPLAEGDAHEI